MPLTPLGPGPEFDRIRRIAAVLGPRGAQLGDDCAVVEWPGGALVLSVDLALEDVHFRRSWLSPREIGWRAGAAALSDLAADGAEPVGMLTSVGLPPDFGDQALEGLARGLGEVAALVGAVVLGGDLSRAERLILDVVAVGRAERPVTRAGARPGDGIWVTGSLGGARAAWSALEAGRPPDRDALERFAHPVPRIVPGRVLAAAGARAMLDVSDGVAGDARHLAAASDVALDVDLGTLPLGPGVVAEAEKAGQAPAVFAAQGGEDYELLVALPEDFSRNDALALQRTTGVGLTRVGTVRAGSGVSFRYEGAVLDLSGYDHFA
jgi:thiamine-monophosphate kinase